MYYNFDFDKDTEFFNNSKTIAFMKKQLGENKHLKNIPEVVYNASVKLWAESIIKHNLDINMTRVEHIHLISNQNSSEVMNIIGKIMFKDKHSRTNEEFNILREQRMVANYLDLIVLSVKEDICSDLKNEFIEYQNLQLNSRNKNKLK